MKKKSSLISAALSLILLLSLSGCGDENKKEYDAAMSLYDSGSFIAAKEAFEALGEYNDSAAMAEKSWDAACEKEYRLACELIQSESFDSAMDIFGELGEYKDSRQKLESIMLEMDYRKAIYFSSIEEYSEAAEIFSRIIDYKDSKELLGHCTLGSIEKLISDNKYSEANDALNKTDKRDSEILYLFNRLKTESYVNLKEGSSLIMGEYEQDGIDANGSEGIEWVCLEIKDNKALVLSKYALDEAVFNERHDEVTWEYSTLRARLNGEFYETAFTTEEKQLILLQYIESTVNYEVDQYSGQDTIDRIFQLSIEEYKKYFPNYNGVAAPTAAAVIHGCDTDLIGNCWWWTRTNGIDYVTAAIIDSEGKINATGTNVINDFGAMRPAMWIEINK